MGLRGNLSVISTLASQTSLAGRRLCQNVKEYKKVSKTVSSALKSLNISKHSLFYFQNKKNQA